MSGAVLVTRPCAQADAFGAEIADVAPVLMSPMLEIVPAAYEAPDWHDYDALIVTSANAVAFIGAAPRDMDVIAVGAQTAARLREAGFEVARAQAGDVFGLIEDLDADQRYLHVRGADVAVDMPAFVESLVVYRAVVVEQFAPGIVAALRGGDIVAVTLFSVRSAENFMRLIVVEGLADCLSGISALCISQNVLDCVHAYGWARTAVAVAPHRAGMIETLREMING